MNSISTTFLFSHQILYYKKPILHEKKDSSLPIKKNLKVEIEKESS